MLSYCLKSRNNTEDYGKTKNVRIMLSSNCVVCCSKKSTFIKEEEASGLLTGLLGVK